MKIQCGCGAKYSFDITPEMAASTIRFVCPACNQDSSELINQLVRQEFGNIAPQPSPPAAPTPAPQVAPLPAAAPALRIASSASPTSAAPGPTLPVPPPANAPVRVATSSLRVNRPASAEETVVATAADEPPKPVLPSQLCKKHPTYVTIEKCVVCGKPICQQCMEIFGYLCSAYCKGKAEADNIDVPFYQNQKHAVEAQYWRKTGRIGAIIGLVFILFVGLWAWYSFFGSRPGVAFSVKFPERSYSGQCFLCDNNQAVVLHAGKLARHDMKSKKEIWSAVLIDKEKIHKEVLKNMKEEAEVRERIANTTGETGWGRSLTEEERYESAERSAIGSLQLYVKGQNVWISFPEKLVRFDWQTGQMTKEVALTSYFHRLIPRGDELLFVEETDNGERLTHFSLATGESKTEEIAGQRLGSLAAVARNLKNLAGSKSALIPADKPIDPANIAKNFDRLPFAAKLALPATLSVAMNQQRALAEMRDDQTKAPVDPELDLSEHFTLVPDGAGFMQFAVRLMEQKIITREAMKARPTKSALEGNVNASSTVAVANEILNDLQRGSGGSTIQEDVSTYHVTFRRPGNDAGQWSGEVTGRPQLWPQKTVIALTAGKSVLVFDRSGKKLWQSTLNYEVVGAYGDDFDDEDTELPSPVTEHGDTLYVFDQGVLSAFDLATGNARWRVQSVGISRIFFDGTGGLYANTTTATPDNIRFAKQINVADKINSVIMKVDAKKGKILWQRPRKGNLTYVSGKYLYATEISGGDEYEEISDLEKIGQALHGAPHIFIWRINPKNGEVMWEHYQERPPLDVQFDKNRIEILFKKELQVLKYFSL